MNKLKQKELVMAWVKEYGEITPAKLGGKIYRGEMFGSEVSRVCRKLRAEGKLKSVKNGRFTRFIPVMVNTIEKDIKGQQGGILGLYSDDVVGQTDCNPYRYNN